MEVISSLFIGVIKDSTIIFVLSFLFRGRNIPLRHDSTDKEDPLVQEKEEGEEAPPTQEKKETLKQV
jgi:hypothetical protein